MDDTITTHTCRVCGKAASGRLTWQVNVERREGRPPRYERQAVHGTCAQAVADFRDGGCVR